jgi:hypothetical protein
VLRRLSACMPRPEDSGGPAPPRPYGGARVAFGSVQTLGVRHKPLRSCTSPAGGAVTPTASRIRCRRFVHLVRRVSDSDSALDARRDTGGGLALPRQGLSPCKRRQAGLGARTLAVSRVQKRERGTSGRWRASPAPTMPSRAAPTPETGPYHPTAIEYNRAEQSRVQTQPRSGDSRPALHAGPRSRLCPTLGAETPMSTLWTRGDRA